MITKADADNIIETSIKLQGRARAERRARRAEQEQEEFKEKLMRIAVNTDWLCIDSFFDCRSICHFL